MTTYNIDEVNIITREAIKLERLAIAEVLVGEIEKSKITTMQGIRFDEDEESFNDGLNEAIAIINQTLRGE